MKTLLVTTGNGMFGRAVIEALANNPQVQVRAMVRNVDSFDFQADNVTAVYGDMDKPETLPAVMAGITDIFLVSPMDEHIAERETNVVQAAINSEQQIRVLKLHGAVDHKGDHLSSLHQKSIELLQSSELPWTYICPNSVMETSFLGLADTIKQGFILGTSGHGKVGMVALADVGQATAAIVAQGSCVAESVYLTGPAAIDMYQAAATFSQVLGREIAYQDLDEDQYAQILIEAGAFPDQDTIEMQVLCHYRAWGRGDASLVSDDFQRVTGHVATSFATWVEQNRHIFTPADHGSNE